MVLIKDVMINDVEVVEKDDMLSEAAAKMSSKGISCVVILEQGKAAGIVTRRDIMERVVVNGLNPRNVAVHEVMVSPVITVSQEQSLLEAADLMNNNGIKQIPVVINDLVSGIITQTDIIKHIREIIASNK